MTDLCASNAVTLAGMLRRREVSAREVTAAHVQRIEAVDGAVNAVVTRTFGAAMDRAARADEALARGAEPGPLHGLPVAHKDLHDTAGVRTTYGSVLFASHVPDHDALVVQRMAQAGAISLGKTNTPEFGAGSHTVNPVFGATRNPYDLSRSAGGSSGGAAAALAARMISLADGSDLGGSLRNPAGFCNVVGLRPSPGRVPGLARHRRRGRPRGGGPDGAHGRRRRAAAVGAVRPGPAGAAGPGRARAAHPARSGRRAARPGPARRPGRVEP